MGAALGDYASRLRHDAAALRACSQDPVRALQASGWTGRRASELLVRLTDRRREIDDLAAQCEAFAADADQLAGDFRQQVRRMQHLENSVRSWIRSLPPDMAHAFTAAQHLPVPGSPEWAAVVRAARQAGAQL